MIKCSQCCWTGHEDDLKLVKDREEFLKGCPKCLTDQYLMDVDPKENELFIITREKFVSAVGREPENDDLDRCNCSQAGEVGHYHCGWDKEADLPEFETGTRLKKQIEDDESASHLRTYTEDPWAGAKRFLS